MSIRAIILTRTKEAIVKNLNLKTVNFKYKEGLYVVTPEAIANYERDGKVKGSEILFFEGNPNPITTEGIVDSSVDFLDDEVLVNALKQTSVGPRVDLSGISDFLSGMGAMITPANIIWLLFYGLIAYALASSFMRGELFG
jgi:hypothetical protein